MGQVKLTCGYRPYLDTGRNPFVAYDQLKQVEEHFRRCLPCLLNGSFRTTMTKEIQKFILSAVIRILCVVCPWIALLSSFLWVHRITPVTSNDAPWGLICVLVLAANSIVALADGPSEFQG